MPILNEYPHSLEYLVTSNGYEDPNGDFHEGESHYEGLIPCDAVPAGKAEERAFEDGIVKTYSYTVYLKANCRAFNIGDKVKLHLLEGVTREYFVKGFHRYQIKCKLWL